MPRLRLLLPAVLAVAVLGGCGESVDQVNDTIDRNQERVERARDAVEDPLGAAEREADRALEDAISPQDQP